MDLESLLNVDGLDAEELRKDIIAAIEDYANNRPRNLQKEIGPSGAGTECTRKLAYAVNYKDQEGPNKYTNPLPSLIGTSMHITMEDVVAMWNAKIIMAAQRERHAAGVLNALGPSVDGNFVGPITEYVDLADAIQSVRDGKHQGPLRFLSENKVPDAEFSIAGTCDFFDTWSGTIVDWKFLGNDTFTKYAKKGTPPTHYKVQGHLYGAGMVALGYEVKKVSIMMFPRSGRLKDAKLWQVDFDPEVAAKAVARVRAVKLITADLKVSENPYKFKHISATPNDADCFFCPHFSPAPSANPYHCLGTSGRTDAQGHLIDEES